jgi:hypothetical protein
VALTILSRFLGEKPSEDLLTSLAKPGEAALSSIKEVLAEAERNPGILVEYVQALDQQEPDVVLASVQALRDLEGDGVELLRMMAQDVRDEIAAAALQALGTLRLPASARALQTLLPTTAPQLRPMAERLLRKMQFAGLPIQPLPAPSGHWRSLVGAVDGMGRRFVWFILGDKDATRVSFLNILLSDQAGAVESAGHRQVSTLVLPPKRPLGHLHDVALPDGTGALLMLEAPFALGRRLVLDALALNRDTQIPIATTLRWLSPWLWESEIEDSQPLRELPQLPPKWEHLVALSEGLLAHPAFATWTLRTQATLQAVGEALHQPGWDREAWVQRLGEGLMTDPNAAAVLAQRLASAGELLYWAGEEYWSAVARATGRALQEGMYGENPFVIALVRRDLDWTLKSLEGDSEPVHNREENG